MISIRGRKRTVQNSKSIADKNKQTSLRKLEIEGNFPNPIKSNYEKVTVNIILNGKRVNSFPIR